MAKVKSYKAKSEYSKLAPKPSGFNANLTSPGNRFMLNLLGSPRKDGKYGEKDGPLDNPELEKLIVNDVKAGPLKVKGIKKAVESLQEVMVDIEKEQKKSKLSQVMKIALEKIYHSLSHDGMLVVRYQRPSKKYPIGRPNRPISNHSWGTAIDLKIDGVLDIRGDNKTQKGLALIAPFFNSHGWYWGAAYRTEDSMHFEVSKEKLLEWAKAGDLGPRAEKVAKSPGLRAESTRTPTPVSRGNEARARQTVSSRANTNILKRGDKGPAVQLLQKKLNKAGSRPQLEPDASFGRHTEDAVRSFQRKKQLKVTGIVDRETQQALSRIRIETPTLWERLLTGMQRIYH